MSDPRITAEAVEAAAKAIYETPHDSLSRAGYDRAPRDIQKLYLAEARGALDAALPRLAPGQIDPAAAFDAFDNRPDIEDTQANRDMFAAGYQQALTDLNGSQSNG